MTPPIPFAIHYLLDGVARHFYIFTSKLDDTEAAQLATRHAQQGGFVAPTQVIASLVANHLGVTKVRWNMAV